MMKETSIHIILIALISISCNNASQKQKGPIETVAPAKTTQHVKPGSSFSDTLIIEQKAAVFFFPDSIQLKKIEELTEKGIFESMMHEYEYQVRNSKMVLKKDWATIKIVEATNVRYILFKRDQNNNVIIDLDNKDDSHGLFLFDGIKEPHYADMMNIDTELPRYFTH